MDKQGIKILIVEDDKDEVALIRHFIRLGMKGVEFTIDHVASFSEAMSYLDRVRYDVCLLNYRLGGMDSLNLLQEVRSKGVNTPVIFLIEEGDEEIATQAMKAGMMDYLTKAKLSPELVFHSIRCARELYKKEEARKQAEEQVRKLSRIIEQGPIVVMIMDTGGNLEYVNPKFTQVTGYLPEEIIGTNVRDLSEQSPEEYKQMWDTLISGRDWQGELHSKKKSGELYWEFASILPIKTQEEVITHFVAVKEDLTQRKRDEETIYHLAYYDALTGLPNRTLFNDRLTLALAHAHRSQEMLGVVFFDVDRFKTIIDTLGHAMGDRLLQTVAKRVTSCLRETDTMARLSGDEFMLLLPGIAQLEDTVKIVQKIFEVLNSSFHLDGHEFHITASMGIALYPNDGEDVQTLLKNANTALHRAKEQGPNTYQFYTPTMNAKAFERLALENSLRRALERREFVVYYQPQVDLRTGQVTGMEALVRWQHPDLGLISPMKFIPLAEETDLIVPLSEWILHTACAQTKAWQDIGLPPLRITVNLSARYFKHKDLIKTIEKILKETELDPNYLELELTESIIMETVEVTIMTLRKLKGMGIHLSIDDFGTGYSSLSYLKRFPIDTLKIDQSFVKDIPIDSDDAAIARAIIAMARTLKLKVIAEGVETEEQLAFLRLYQCNEMQGYLFSRPVPAEAFIQLLQEKRHLTVDK